MENREPRPGRPEGLETRNPEPEILHQEKEVEEAGPGSPASQTDLLPLSEKCGIPPRDPANLDAAVGDLPLCLPASSNGAARNGPASPAPGAAQHQQSPAVSAPSRPAVRTPATGRERGGLRARARVRWGAERQGVKDGGSEGGSEGRWGGGCGGPDPKP